MIPKLGIGVITYNRLPVLLETLKNIQRYTSLPFELVVADDGSSDGTSEALTHHRIPHIKGENRGIAWNRNRALWWLKEVKHCQQIIIFEDDCCPMEYGWEVPWVDAIERFGHVNYLPELTLQIDNDVSHGEGTPESPFIAPMHQALCVGYHTKALNFVGYLDPRFRRYGEEHVEHTHRFLRAGYGGLAQHLTPERGQVFYLKSNFKSLPCTTTCDSDSLAYNIELYRQIQNDPIYRAPWQNDAQMLLFRNEIENAFSQPLPPAKWDGWNFDYIVSLSDGLTPLLTEIFGADRIGSSFFEGYITPFHALIELFQTDFRRLFYPGVLYAYHGRLRCKHSLIVYNSCLDAFSSKEEGLVEHMLSIRHALVKKYDAELRQLDKICKSGKKVLFVRDWRDALRFEGTRRPANSPSPDFKRLGALLQERYPDLDFRILFTNFGDAFTLHPKLIFANISNLKLSPKEALEEIFKKWQLTPTPLEAAT